MPSDRWWARWTLHVHHAYHAVMFATLSIGAIGLGVVKWQEARDESRNPLADPYVQGALPLMAFAVLVTIIITQKAMRRPKLKPGEFGGVYDQTDDFQMFDDDDGYAIMSSGLHAHELNAMREESDTLQAANARTRAGIRDPLAQSPLFAEIERKLRPFAESLLGRPVFPVRSILFDKTPETNWDVVWHQDVTIAVRERIDVEGFGPWSIKQGVHSVQPPASVLEQMVTLRLHLDDCPADNGPLLVVPGSQDDGFVDVRTLDTAACERDALACAVSAGSVLAMRPLLLHASKKSEAPGHRRVLHIDYACEPLPGGLQWTTDVS